MLSFATEFVEPPLHFLHVAPQRVDRADDFLELEFLRRIFGAGVLLRGAFELFVHLGRLLREAFGDFVHPGCTQVFDRDLEVLEPPFHVSGLSVYFAGWAKLAFESGDMSLDVRDRVLPTRFAGLDKFLACFIELPVPLVALGLAIFFRPSALSLDHFNFPGKPGEVFFAALRSSGVGFLFEVLDALAKVAVLRMSARDEREEGENSNGEEVWRFHAFSVASGPASDKQAMPA